MLLMVSTIKFSEFAAANVDDDGNTLVGLSGGLNAKGATVNRWTSANRPIAPFDGLSGYNLDLGQWEFWNATQMEWLQFSTSSSGGFTWSVITAPNIIADTNSGLITDRSATPVQILLPAVFQIGDLIIIMGLGAGGWNLVANSGQNILFGDVSSSVDGAINSDITNSVISVRGLVPNTTWLVNSTNSNPFYV